MLTRLDVINRMLASIGTAPLSNEDAGHPMYMRASDCLDTVDLECQMQGWWYNKSVTVLPRATTGYISVPSDAISVDPTDTNSPVIRRGYRLFDPIRQSYIFDNGIEVHMVTRLPLPELPPSAQLYVKAEAVRTFFLDEDGDELKLRVYMQDAERALQKLRAEHLKHSDVNVNNYGAAARLSARSRWSRNPKFPGGYPY